MSKAHRIETTGTTPGFRRGLLKMCLTALVSFVFVQLVACNSAAVSEENSRLRRANLDLYNKVNQLKQEVELRDGQIAALNKKINAPGPAVEGVQPSDLPVVSKLAFGAYSGPYDSDGDGSVDTVRVYLLTLDQHGRFYPAVGKAEMQAVLIEADQPPKQVAQKTFDAKAFGGAYVSGFTGTHFTLELKLDAPRPRDTELTIKVTYTDAATGVILTQQMAGKSQ